MVYTLFLSKQVSAMQAIDCRRHPTDTYHHNQPPPPPPPPPDHLSSAQLSTATLNNLLFAHVERHNAHLCQCRHSNSRYMDCSLCTAFPLEPAECDAPPPTAVKNNELHCHHLNEMGFRIPIETAVCRPCDLMHGFSICHSG
jgi:hypothetical protein